MSISIELKNTGKSSEDLFSQYSSEMTNVIEDVKSRAGKEGQFLNWIGELPRIQLENIDNIYNLAAEAKKGGYNKLAVIGIGGSRHTTESFSKMLDYDNGITFYCGIDNESFRRFIAKLDLDTTKFLVVSKSGTTLEPSSAYEKVRAIIEEKYGKEEAKNHFIAMTDANPATSKLRQRIDAGEIALSGFVHDDVGGRFSIFDDATLFTLAFQGMPKEEMKAMLETIIASQENFLNTDINNNLAAQQAIFNVDAKRNGKSIHFVEVFGDAFEGLTLWEKQKDNESIKANYYTDSNVGPAYLHYNAESDLDPNNKCSFFTFVNVEPEADDYDFQAVVTGVVNAYSKQHPVSHVQISDYSANSMAELIEFKHLETLFTGALMRNLDGDITPENEALAEVLQPNVETYKKEVKKAKAELECKA